MFAGYTVAQLLEPDTCAARTTSSLPLRLRRRLDRAAHDRCVRRWRRSHRDPRPFVLYPLMALMAPLTVLVSGAALAEGSDGLLVGLFIAAGMTGSTVMCWRIARADIYTSTDGVRVTRIMARSETVRWEHLSAVEVHPDKLDRIVFRTVFGSRVYSDVYRCPRDRIFEVLTDRENASRYTALLGPKSFDRLVTRLRDMRDRADPLRRGSTPPHRSGVGPRNQS